MKEKQFEIQKIAWHEVADKITLTPISKVLNSLNLLSYGSSVSNITFIYIGIKPTNTRHENSATYENSTITIQLGLSYPHIIDASPERMLEMMAGLFLVSIDLYPSFKLTDFDILAFRKDVEDLFQKQGWLKPVPQV